MISTVFFLAYYSGSRLTFRGFIFMIFIIFCSAIYSELTILYKKRQSKKEQEIFLESIASLVREGTLRAVSDSQAVVQSVLNILQNSFNLKPPKITLDIFSICLRQCQDYFFYLVGFQQMEKKRELVRDSRPVSEMRIKNYLDNRLAVFAPINMGKINSFYVRCRLLGREEENIAYDEKRPSILEKPAVDQFGAKFIVQGDNPQTAERILTGDVQQILVDSYGDYPLEFNQMDKFRLFVCQEGLLIFSDISPDSVCIKRLLSLTEKIYPHILRASNPQEDEEIFRIPG